MILAKNDQSKSGSPFGSCVLVQMSDIGEKFVFLKAGSFAADRTFIFIAFTDLHFERRAGFDSDHICMLSDAKGTSVVRGRLKTVGV